MSRSLTTILGILLLSSVGVAQEFVVPQKAGPLQTNRASFQPPSNSRFASSRQQAEPPTPEIEPARATIQPAARDQLPAVQTRQTTILSQPQNPESSAISELPAPKQPVIELKEDKSTYRSTPHNNFYGFSDYSIAVARERARARRMRMEAKKWYGIDSSRPAVAPHGYLPTYSAYYNGVFSRPGYQYNRGANFYFYVPVSR